MAVVSTGLSAAGIRGEFFNRFNAVTTYYKDLTTRIPSTTQVERHRFLGATPMMREWGKGRLARGLNAESYDVTNEKYEATLEVDRDEIDDDQLGQIRIRVNELAEVAATHKDYLLETLFANGHSAGFVAYDGHPFFSDAHESQQSGVQSNLVPATAVDPDAPTEAEFRAAMALAIAQMMPLKNDRGDRMRINPDGLIVVCPPTMLFTALQALDVALVGGSVDPLRRNVLQGAASAIALPGLTATDTFFLCKTNVTVRPFIFQERMPVEFQALEYGSEESFVHDKFLYGVRARYTLTYGYWQYAMKIRFT